MQWDTTGTKGVLGKYEVYVVPQGDGWISVVWVHKTHLTTLSQCDSKVDAQLNAEQYVEELERLTERLLDRIGYDDDDEYY